MARSWAKTGWTWVGILLGVGLLEWGLVRQHQPTLSQFVQHWARHLWVRVAVVTVLALFAWHLITPEPLPIPDPPHVPPALCWADEGCC